MHSTEGTESKTNRIASPATLNEIRSRIDQFLDLHPVESLPDMEFHAARFDAGLAFVTFAEGCGGLNAEPALHGVVEDLFLAAGARDWRARNVIGHPDHLYLKRAKISQLILGPPVAHH